MISRRNFFGVFGLLIPGSIVGLCEGQKMELRPVWKIDLKTREPVRCRMHELRRRDIFAIGDMEGGYLCDGSSESPWWVVTKNPIIKAPRDGFCVVEGTEFRGRV